MSARPPSDIHDFWSDTLRAARAVPLDPSVERLPAKLPYFVHRVTFRGLDGVGVRAYLSLPIDTVRGGRVTRPLPAIVTAPGYGGWEFGVDRNECQRGYAILQVYPRGQGESGELWQVDEPHRGHWVQHRKQSPGGFYYRGAVTDLIRGIDFLRSRPEVDPHRIALMGTSQGGMLALQAGAMDEAARAVVAHVPYLCDVRHSPAFEGTLGRDARFLDTWDYFDPVHLAHRIHAPTLLSAGGRDELCPPDTIRAVFDRLPGIKSLAFFPDLTHTSCNDFYGMGWQWIERYV